MGCNDPSQTLCGPPSMTRRAGGVAASGTLKADTGCIRPFSVNEPMSSRVMLSSRRAATRWLIRIWPSLASAHRRAATLQTVPIAV